MSEYGHGGNIGQLARTAGLSPGHLLDFSANINPMGPPEWLRSVISSQIDSLVHYPDPTASSLVEALARHYGVSAEEMLVGNGSSEILYLIPRAVSRSRAVIAVPSYVDYKKVAELSGLEVEQFVLREENGFRLDPEELESKLCGNELVFLGQPNNPTGITFDAERLRIVARRQPSSIFIVDEAFADFIEGMDRLIHDRPPNVIVLCSLTKFYAIPGLRLGCAVASPEIARRVRKMTPPWSVNTLAQAVGERALRDAGYAVRTRNLVRKLRAELMDKLRSLPGLTVYPGEANFLMARLDDTGPDAPSLALRMLKDGLAIRVCDNYDGLDARFFRVAVRAEDENARLFRSLQSALAEREGSPSKQRKPPPAAAHGESSGAAAGNNSPALHVRSLYASPMSGEAIEAESFRIIDREAPLHRFGPEEWQIVRRLIHTTGDCSLMEAVRISPDAIASAVDALRNGRPLYADSNMIRSGLSLSRLRSVCPEYGPESIHSHVADAEVAEEARNAGMPRSLYAVRKAAPMLHGAIALFGNAPVALLELNRLIVEEEVRPAVVIAMPVGFVHVIESKEELMALGVPFIALSGRRGGSPLAVSVVHALCSIAASQKERLAPDCPAGR